MGAWAEGYTYFRCAAGLLDADLATFIDYEFDPRSRSTLPSGLFCKFVKEMLSVGDIGQGLTIQDLQVLNFIPSAETDCGLTAGTLGTAGNKNDDSTDDDDKAVSDDDDKQCSTGDDSTDDDDKKIGDDSTDDDDKAGTGNDDDDDDNKSDAAAFSRVGMTALGVTLLSMVFSL